MSSTPPPTDRRLGDFSSVDTADSGDLVARLDAMHALGSFQDYKRESFDLLRVGPGSTVADIGCGTGNDARNIAARVTPGGHVTGFDLSEDMLTAARARHAGVGGLRFEQAGADGLGGPDDRFDAVRADRVLIHVPDPVGTLAEMVRVTRPGGRVVISEPDMPGCWIATDRVGTANAVMGAIAQSCITPYLARDLWAAFKDAGLTDVSLSVRTVTAFDPPSVAQILDLAGVADALARQGVLATEEVAAWKAELDERGRSGRFVAAVCIMTVAGTKP